MALLPHPQPPRGRAARSGGRGLLWDAAPAVPTRAPRPDSSPPPRRRQGRPFRGTAHPNHNGHRDQTTGPFQTFWKPSGDGLGPLETGGCDSGWRRQSTNAPQNGSSSSFPSERHHRERLFGRNGLRGALTSAHPPSCCLLRQGRPPACAVRESCSPLRGAPARPLETPPKWTDLKRASEGA